MNIKKSLLPFVLLFMSTALIFTSCKEQSPPGLDLGGGAKVADSSYTASIEAKQDKGIMIEELTGVDCANCPKAATAIKSMATANPGRIFAAGLHPPSSGFTIPLPNSKYDFRQPKVDEITTKLGGIGGLPSGSLNRVKTSSDKFFDSDYNAWISRVTPWLSQTTPLNIHLVSTYGLENNTCEVVAKVAFTETVSDELYITIYVLENDIKDYQNDGGNKISDYKHMHVFRDCVTSISGSTLNYSNKNAGTVLQKRVSFSPVIEGDNAWNLDNCHILAFVHKTGADQSIVHAQEINLK